MGWLFAKPIAQVRGDRVVMGFAIKSDECPI
jgi:hypothetical protein